MLDEALAKALVSITEVSAAGSVPELRVQNDADTPVLVVDGEALEGAKQNRICNITVLIPAKTVMNIPVSCVERGRWSYQRKDFATADHMLYNSSRARKAQDVTASLRTSGVPRADQGEIWRDISRKSQRMAAVSGSEAMSVLFQTQHGSLAATEKVLAPRPGEVGAIFARESAILGLETFDAPSSWQSFGRKVLRSYGLDALDRHQRPVMHFHDPEELLDELRACSVAEFPSLGLGSDVRVEHPRLSGGALMALNTLVHVAVFATL
jgi:hypothetical protein